MKAKSNIECADEFLPDRSMYIKTGGRHLVDIIGDFSWTKGVTSRGQF